MKRRNDAVLFVGFLGLVFMMGSLRGRTQERASSEVGALAAIEVADDLAEEKHDRFARCIRRLYNAGFPAEHDPVLLCEEQVRAP